MHEEARDVGKILADKTPILEALRKAAWEALRVHRAADQPLAIWRDGRVVWVTPDEFERGLLRAR